MNRIERKIWKKIYRTINHLKGYIFRVSEVGWKKRYCILFGKKTWNLFHFAIWMFTVLFFYELLLTECFQHILDNLFNFRYFRSTVSENRVLRKSRSYLRLHIFLIKAFSSKLRQFNEVNLSIQFLLGRVLLW